MTTVPELVAKLDSDQNLVDTAASGVDGSRFKTEECIQAFHNLGVESSQAGAMLQSTDEMLENIRHGLEEMAKSIEEARNLVEQAEGRSLTGEVSYGGATVEVVGDPVTAPASGPGDLQKELEDTGDSKKSRATRAGRVIGRQASGLKDAVADQMTASTSDADTVDEYRPELDGTTTSTGMPPPRVPEITVHHNAVDIPSFSGSLVFGASAALIAFGNIRGSQE